MKTSNILSEKDRKAAREGFIDSDKILKSYEVKQSRKGPPKTKVKMTASCSFVIKEPL